MNKVVTTIAAGGLLAIFAAGQTPQYRVVDLGTLQGGTFSQPSYITNQGLITGVSTAADGTQHSVLWYKGWVGDFGTSPLGGPNSGMFGLNERDQADGQAETRTKDPNNENFCAYGTGFTCLAYLWQGGVSTALPTLGGNNSTVGNINSQGEIAGMAQNSTRDAVCPAVAAVNGTGPEVLDYEAVIWGPKAGEIRALPPLPGDTVGMAFWVNDNGQAVGASGTCANTVLPPFAGGPHAVLWDKNGSAHDLGNLGGTGNAALLGIVNIAFVVNNSGQITGGSVLAGNTNVHAFLWTDATGMQDLGTLPGDVNSAGLGLNDRGVVVGASIDGSPATGNPRAFVWQNGVMTDLNTFLTSDGPFVVLLQAGAVNARGEIVGLGVTNRGDLHGFLAIPKRDGQASESTQAESGRSAVPANVRTTMPRVHFGR